MGTSTFSEKLTQGFKHFVYTTVLPIYLWSIGVKSLEDYITQIEEDYERYHRSASKQHNG